MSTRLTIALPSLLLLAHLRDDAGTSRSATAAHDIHLTHTRVTVAGASVTCRIRLFHDDLQLALRQFARQPLLRVGDATPQDSLFGAYFDSTAVLRADGVVLRGRVVRSGRDVDASEFPMWWYEVELHAERPVRVLGVRYDLLFEQFRDQRNILTVVREPDDRHSLYFAAGQRGEQTIRFGTGAG